MNTWLVKQEPSTYPFSRFLKEKTVVWDGVRNYQARNFLRQMKKGDRVLYYHNDFLYSPDSSGVYTDTAEFTLLIPECTNISVGYDHEHTTNESLDINHYDALAKAVVQIDWDALPAAREVAESVLFHSQCH